MNKTVKRIVMAVSAVTLIGTISACGPWSHRNDPEDMAQYMVGKVTKTLELTDAQAAKLNTLKDQALKARADIHATRDESRPAALALLEQPALDRAAASAMINAHLQKMAEKAPPLVDAFGDFYDSLTAPQQQKLRTEIADRIERHHNHGPQH